MLIAYPKMTKDAPQAITSENQALLKTAVWIDLLSPTKEEEAYVEQHLGIDVPTREEMVEIEVSSRLYKNHDVTFMTAPMIAQSASREPQFDPVTFILTPQQLITIRYIEPHAFHITTLQLKKQDVASYDAATLLITLLDCTVDRLADILELVGRRLDDYSKTIFRPSDNNDEKLDYRLLMQHMGAHGDLNTKARESLVTFNRLIAYFEQTASSKIHNEGHLRLTTLSKDIIALGDYSSFLSTKINFLLDATLGMINIEQNNIVKIFSIAAVIFLPPTLISSIYGMNFHFMPELSWRHGYAIALGVILMAAWLPYKYFKYRKWL